MPSPPPRLAPTVVLAALWVVLYLLYLSVKPEPPASTGRNDRATTTTSAPGAAAAAGTADLSRMMIPAGESVPAL